MRTSTVIAVDGPVAAGKGTLARSLAESLGLRHLDSGMIYRAAAVLVLDRDGDPGDPEECRKAAESLVTEDLEHPGLRDQAIGEAASRIAAHRDVRAALLDFQRHFAAMPPGAVVDGRDVGTVVFPDADVKLFVTAEAGVRALRRHRELVRRGEHVTFEAVSREIAERDRRDTERRWAPLRQADDAVVIDTTDLDADAAACRALDIVRARLRAGNN